MASSRNWEDYNEELVKRGSILLDLDFVADWSRELKGMNERKEGARFRYPDPSLSCSRWYTPMFCFSGNWKASQEH